LFLIDIAVPRDVDPTVDEIDNVYRYDIDNLSRVVAETLQVRAAEAERAEAIVAEEIQAFLVRRSQDAALPIIVGMRERVQQTVHAELEKSLQGRLKHLGAADREALAAMMGAVVNKLLHHPSTRLKALAGEQRCDDAAQVLTELFDLRQALIDSERRPEPEIVTAELDATDGDAADADAAGATDSGNDGSDEQRQAVAR
jgi:glutamyl-tRNA reductase